MKFAKGAAQGSLSRGAVDWMVRTTDLTTYIEQWNKGVRHILICLFLIYYDSFRDSELMSSLFKVSK